PEQDDDEGALADLAERIAAEDVQLYYQIATTGRRDLALAPDARTGFEMAVLRMLAFRPGAEGGAELATRRTSASHVPAPSPPRASSSPSPPARAPVAASPRPAPAPAATASPDKPVATPVARDANGLPDWDALIERADLRGPFSVLAQNAVLRERDGQTLVLALQPTHMSMAVEPMVSQMEERIGQAMGERIRLRFVSPSQAAAMPTPAARAAQARDSAQAAAEQAIEDDPLVQTLKRDFGARVVPQSVKPLGNEPGAM